VGEVIVEPERLTGDAVNIAARIESFAAPGGVMLSDDAYAQLRNRGDVSVVSLGEFRLKNVGRPFELYGIAAEGVVVPDPAALDGKGERVASLPSNLPAAAGPLMGRAADLAAISGLVQSHRVVTISGPGGVGKTTVLAELGRQLASEFLDGVAFAALAEVTRVEDFLPTLAEALDVKEAENRTLGDGIVALIADRRALLLLDNLEQVVDAAPAVAGLVESCPELRVLTTSRTPLRIAAEHEYQLAPLGTDSAVALFTERARRTRASFELTSENAEVVEELCRRLDGLPLALELAAARLRVLSPEALLERLDHALDVLVSGSRDSAERQQTLRATIDWSLGLLDEEERHVFARLSVFAGGFRLGAAEAVCEAGLDSIETLLENSLLRSDEQADGESRFSMLESIGDYARELLERDAAAENLRRRHADWYAEWLERRANARLTGALAGNWEPEDEERDNIRAALAWAHERGLVDVELRFAAFAGLYYWPSRGHLTEGRRWLDDVLARSANADERLRAHALLAAAQHAWRQRDYDGCDRLAAEAQSVFERRDDRPPLALALSARAIAAQARGDAAAERAFNEAAEQILQELGHRMALDAILGNRAYAEIVAGNFESAERLLRGVAESATGQPRLVAAANHGLALALLGRLDEADARFAEVIQLSVAADPSPELLLHGFEGLACVAASRADDERAAQLWGVTSGISEATGYTLALAEQRFHDQLVPEVRERLGDDAFGLERDAGRQLSFEEALGLALRRD
jgi:predicted ATPase